MLEPAAAQERVTDLAEWENPRSLRGCAHAADVNDTTGLSIEKNA